MLQSLRSFLEVPTVYRLWTNLVGGPVRTEALVKQYIQPSTNDRILEIGCGPGTMVPHLPRSGYLGFDLSPYCIELAKKRYPDARFVCERVSKFSLTEYQSFDLVVASGIVHHLEDAEATQLFKIAHDALRVGGRLVTIDGVYTKDQSPIARWLLARDRGRYVRNEEQYVRLASQVFTVIEPIVRHDILRIPFSHLILQCRRT